MYDLESGAVRIRMREAHGGMYMILYICLNIYIYIYIYIGIHPRRVRPGKRRRKGQDAGGARRYIYKYICMHIYIYIYMYI